MDSVSSAQIPPAEGSAGLRIGLLGPVTIRRGDGVLSLPSRKARALLGYLALREGAPVSRGALTGLLWGERGEAQARASLRQALTELRAALGLEQGALVATREAVGLAVEAAYVDARSAAALAASGELRAAAELLGGELMEGLETGEAGFEEWLAIERERFRRLAVGPEPAAGGGGARGPDRRGARPRAETARPRSAAGGDASDDDAALRRAGAA
jgi:DNA-binding winged helix-turn-helix (wHTH) protein